MPSSALSNISRYLFSASMRSEISLTDEIWVGVPSRATRWASSAEFVGRFRFGEPPQVVIKGNFHGFVGAKAIGSSGHHSDFVVEAFHSAIGDFSFGPKPIQDQWFMGA